MPRITAVDPAVATGAAKQLLDVVQSKFGMTPNLMRTLANAPAALKGFLDLNNALAGGVLDSKFREQIALAVAQANDCDYCLSAHTTIGAMVGLTPNEIAASREGRSFEARRDAGLKLAQSIVASRGQVPDDSILKARAAGLNDAEMTEIVVNVALNILTNYLNHLAQTVMDFPPVEATLAAKA